MLAVSANTTLTTLQLANVGGGGQAARAVAMLLANSSVANVQLASNNLGDCGATALARSLTAHAPSYHASVAFGSRGSSSAFQLVTLDLTRTSIGGAGAAQLAHMLCSNSTLKHLDLSWNNVRGTGTQFFFPLAFLVLALPVQKYKY